MKRFEFSLAALLKYRLLEEEQAQQDLYQASVKLKEQRLLLEQLNQIYADTNKLFRSKQTEVTTAMDLLTYSQYGKFLKDKMLIQNESVLQAEQKYRSCQDILEAAMKKRKLLEKLKEKAWNEYQCKILKEEQNELDEMGLQSFVQKR